MQIQEKSKIEKDSYNIILLNCLMILFFEGFDKLKLYLDIVLNKEEERDQ
jgi:hypothetical protein